MLPIMRLSKYGGRAAHNDVGVHLTGASDNGKVQDVSSKYRV